jgi:RimJ/RimL family protein N-acetyltransferase
MGLELAPCEPKFSASSSRARRDEASRYRDAHVRQVKNSDLDELHRLQNCPESTRSTFRIPPITKEETKKWYEKLNSEEGKHCLACFKGDKLIGYLHFRTHIHPFPCLKTEEILVDVNEGPEKAAQALIEALQDFKERYWYRRIFAYTPETSVPIIRALAKRDFRKTGAMKDYLFIDGYYVNEAVLVYP